MTTEEKLLILAKALDTVVFEWDGKYLGPSESDKNLTPVVEDAMKIVKELNIP